LWIAVIVLKHEAKRINRSRFFHCFRSCLLKSCKKADDDGSWPLLLHPFIAFL
jgi:hypothetical protein